MYNFDNTSGLRKPSLLQNNRVKKITIKKLQMTRTNKVDLINQNLQKKILFQISSSGICGSQGKLPCHGG